MSMKKSLLIINLFLIFLTIPSKTFAGFDNEGEKDWCFSTFVRKCFSCFLREKVFDDDQELLYEQDSFSFTSDTLLECKIEELPPEIIWKICNKLPPLDIIQLSLASKNFRAKIDDNFWESYIRTHDQKRWEQPIPAVRIVYAFSLLNKGRIEDAAKLGLPKAIRITRQMRETKEQKMAENLEYSLHSEERSYRPYLYGHRGLYPSLFEGKLRLRNGFGWGK